MRRVPYAVRPAFSLIEALTVMFGLAIALTLGGALLLTVMRADQVGAGNLRELVRRAELADQFRDDVARSDGVPAQFGPWKTDATCLILHLPADKSIVYHWRDGRLERITKSGESELRRHIPIGTEHARIEFQRHAGDRPTIVMTLTEAPPLGVARSLEISATLGGDLR